MTAQFPLRLYGRVLCAASALALFAALLPAQQITTARQKPVPTELMKGILVFPDAYAANYWTHTVALVNAPAPLKLANPGQCIRIGVAAQGDNREALITKTQILYRIRFAGHTNDFPLAAFAQTHPIKPEGGDFVSDALAAAGIANPIPSMVIFGVSASNWCVPADAADGEAVIEGEAVTPNGTVKLAAQILKVESFATGAKFVFKDSEAQSKWTMTYYRQPQPARLIPALRALAADHEALQNQSGLLNAVAFFANVLKSNPLAAKEFAARIGAEPDPARLIGIGMLRESGFDVQPLVQALGPEERKYFDQPSDLPNPYAFNPADGQDPTRLDLCWAEFLATGRIEPIRQIVSALAWRAEYDAFDKARKDGTLRKQWTPELSHAVTYMAAGWSLTSFKHTDPLVADYLQAIAADPATSAAIKTEFKGLDTNPAFRETHGK
ncbi:MAG: hypothetical protein P4L03_05985 [Terracidiphilus sp.]|nr:hypothetical protein [Terracidiphilus sp.]